MYEPRNFNDVYANKKINMIEAIATSDNIYAVKTTLFLGSQTVCDSLKFFDVDCQALPSIALGTPEMSLLKLTSIYNTFASLGDYYKPSLIKKVTTQTDNKVIYTSSNSKTTLLDKDLTMILNQLLGSFDPNINSFHTYTKYYVKDICCKASTYSDSMLLLIIQCNYWCMGYNDGKLKFPTS